MQEKNFDCPEFTHSYVKITNNDFIKSDLHIFVEKHLKYFFNKKQKGQPKTSGFSKICPINNKNYISAQTIAVGFGNVIEKSIKEWVEKYGWKQFEEFIQSDRRPNSKKGVSADLKIQKNQTVLILEIKSASNIRSDIGEAFHSDKKALEKFVQKNKHFTLI